MAHTVHLVGPNLVPNRNIETLNSFSRGIIRPYDNVSRLLRSHNKNPIEIGINLKEVDKLCDKVITIFNQFIQTTLDNPEDNLDLDVYKYLTAGILDLLEYTRKLELFFRNKTEMSYIAYRDLCRENGVYRR